MGRAGPARRRPLLTALLAGASLFPAAAAGQEAHRAILAEKLRAELAEIAAGVPGVMGVAVVDLTTGERFVVNDTLTFPQGSAIKVPVLIELFRQAEAGRVRLDERVPIRAVDQVGGSGILRHFADGASALSLRDLAVLMIVLSDNTATNVLIERLGMQRVNRTLGELGLPNTRLQRMMIRPEESARGNENLSTPADAAALMARLARCELPVSEVHCAEIRRILEVPKGGPLADPLPPGTRIAWKPGGIEGVLTGWGLVSLPGRPYVVVAMVNYTEGGPAGEAVRRVARASHAYFARLARATPHGARVPLELLPTRAATPQTRNRH